MSWTNQFGLRFVKLEDVRQQLADHAREIAQELLGKPNPSASTKREWRFGRKGSIAVVVDGPKAGLWHDFEQGEGGDMITLIMRKAGVDFLGALEIANRYVGGLPIEWKRARQTEWAAWEQQEERTADWKRSVALDIWREATDIDDTLAATYLAARGILIPDGCSSRVLRFHPDCPSSYRGGNRHPAMVALLRDVVSDEPSGIQRTALSPDGDKIDRLILGTKKGAAIKLSSHVGKTLTIGEGAETVLSGIMLGFAPAWAVVDAGQLGNFPVLEHVEQLTILVDHDEPDRHGHQAGISAAARCADRWTDSGRLVRCILPELRGCDLNDIARGGGMSERH